MVDPASQLLVPKVHDLFFDPRGNWIPSDYKVLHGGRGGLKSWSFARVAVCLAAARRLRFACAREYQTSIEESVHETLAGQIALLGLDAYFDIGKRAITAVQTGSRFFFAGIKTDPAKFKSTEGIDILWIEEGEKLSENSWNTITPTIRKDGSEIWCGFNPDLETDPTSQRFITDPIHEARIVETNWRDNPWLSERALRDKDYLARVDPDAYAHVWNGKFRKNSAAQVLRGKISVEAFEHQLDWDGPYQGADWGFSQDPTTMVRCWISGRKLYIEYESYGIGVDTNLLPEKFGREIPLGSQYVTRADNARPETVSYLQKHDFPKFASCIKWKGSVEDGVAFLRQFESIVIHPRCEHAIEEGRLWSYKVDRLTGDPLPELAEGHDHIWDAVRYALQPMIRKRGSYNFASV